MDKKKISVIVPVYNVEKYLEKSINSIINQTYKNLEILLIDDGSTDNSPKICDELQKKDKRITVIHKINEGVAITKNLGIDKCSGEYIAFVDSDDWIDEDYIETLYKNIINTNSDVSIVSYNVVNEDNAIIKNNIQENEMEMDEIFVYEGLNIIKEVLLQRTIKNFVCKLYKRDVICYYPVGINYEDIVFTFDVMRKSKKVVYMNKKCYNYLKRTDSITATISEKNLLYFANAIFDRFSLVKREYPLLMNYNIYAFLESVVALSTKNIMCERKYNTLDSLLEKYLNIIIEYTKNNEEELLPLLNDYQKLCLYLIKYNNIELYYSFLIERQRLKELGVLK